VSSKAIRIGAIATVLAIGAYWYWSPYLAINGMKSAAREHDADAFNDYVDYPKLRESLKGQFSAALAKPLLDRANPENDLANAGESFGRALGLVFVDKLVDAMIRPEVVMQAMQTAKLKPDDEAPGKVSDTETDQKWDYERKGMDKIIIRPVIKEQPEEAKTGFVFQREGFVSWKLTEIRLPEMRK